jgi:hypothetical protein
MAGLLGCFRLLAKVSSIASLRCYGSALVNFSVAGVSVVSGILKCSHRFAGSGCLLCFGLYKCVDPGHAWLCWDCCCAEPGMTWEGGFIGSLSDGISFFLLFFSYCKMLVVSLMEIDGF